MIIKANNTPALSALEKPKEPESIFKKLATGQIASLFKVDEPSVIDDTMQVKMRELNLNARYAQEAVAVAQTAIEGLDQIQSKLERMQELVAMASEDIYSDEDRVKIQEEIGKINKDINNIVDNTTYNGQKLLTEDGSELEEQAEEPDIVKKILQEFADTFGKKNFTAEAMGTDKVDVSSADAAKNSMDIVEQAIKDVKDAIKDWKFFETKHARYFELDAQEDTSSLKNNPTMIIDALELVKYTLLNTDAQILLDNSSKNPYEAVNLLY